MESKFQLSLWVWKQGREFTSMMGLASVPNLEQRNPTDKIQTQMLNKNPRFLTLQKAGTQELMHYKETPNVLKLLCWKNPVRKSQKNHFSFLVKALKERK